MGLLEDLSAAFVAFTIEVDDAAESRLRHRTTRGGDGRDPSKGIWLASLAMWENCMRWLPEEGLSVAELEATARTPTNLAGMRRWGYVQVEGWARGAKGRPGPEAVMRPTRRGARAQEVWNGVPAEIEARWAGRFESDAPSGRGSDGRGSGGRASGGGAGGRGAGGATRGDGAVAELRRALVALAERLDPGLPDTMPIVRQGWATRRAQEPERRPGPVAVADLGLDSLLARPLSAFALEYEASGRLSLALHANLLAVLGAEPTPLRDLPDATGIHRAQIDNAVGYLERAGLAEVIPTAPVGGGRSGAANAGGTDRSPPGGGTRRGKSVALTARGVTAKSAGARKVAKLEATWDERHGETVSRVREALADLAAGDDPGAPPPTAEGGLGAVLLAGLEHPPGTWRGDSRPLARLPRFPLVTHRGGFPDGA
jgi:hypothetical protein